MDPVLSKFRTAVTAAYGPRLERIVLYGSRARGDATEDSDYDVAIFLKGLSDLWPEFLTLADIEVRLFDETGAIVHAMPFQEGSWNDRRSPIMREIRQDGVDL